MTSPPLDYGIEYMAVLRSKQGFSGLWIDVIYTDLEDRIAGPPTESTDSDS